MLGTRWRMNNNIIEKENKITTLRISNHQTSTLYHHHRHTIFFSLPRFFFQYWDVYQLQLYRGCWIHEALVGLFLWKRWAYGWKSSSAITFAAAVFWFSDTNHFKVRRSLSPSCDFGHCSSQLMTSSPWSVYDVIPLGTAALVTPNKVTVWSQPLQLKPHQQSVLFENQTSLPLQYLHTTCY